MTNFDRARIAVQLSAISVAACMLQNAAAQTVVTINALANRHAISPLVYGVAYASQAQLTDLGATMNRYGGNNASRYNWNLNADNKDNDWYFESWPDSSGSSVAGERGDTFFSLTKAANAQALLTIPMLPYIANLGPNRSVIWSYSIKKYGAQTGNDPWNSDAGNGFSTSSGNPPITNNPLDADVANSPTIQQDWVKHLISTWGTSSQGGVKYYVMDNEPSIWFSTHRDVHPIGETYDEIVNDYETYALNIRNLDPNAVIIGPEEWGWTGYFYSGYDAQYGSTHGWGGPFPDRSAHNNMDHIPYILQTLRSYQASTGKQLLNVLSVHYYPQQGEYGNDDSATMQAIRNRSTRSLWDPNYTDTSWIGSVVELIPRLKNWVSTYYPGLQTAITEYNWGDEGALNGATTQADIDGIFGREGLDLATRWGAPATNTPTYLAMKMYRNYDNANGAFGDTSVSCSVPNADDLSAFASQRSSDGALTVMVINKVTSSAPVKLNLSGFGSGAFAHVYQLSSSTQTAINKLADVAVKSNAITTTVPAQSVTLIVIPIAAEYDFETGTQGWVPIRLPVSAVSTSTAEHYTGSQSLAVSFLGHTGAAGVAVANPPVPAGSTVTFHVWIPAKSKIVEVQPFAQQSGNGTVTQTNYGIGKLRTNAWNTLTLTVPSNATTLSQLGEQFSTKSSWVGTCYIDAVGW